jgi:hypothetical protein
VNHVVTGVVWVLTNKQIEAGAKAIAADMTLPGGGRKKLARLVADHLNWFDAVEERGLTWGDMSRVLFAAGVHGPGGRPIPVGTLSSTVWRKQQEAATSSAPAPTRRGTGQQSRNNDQTTSANYHARVEEKRVPAIVRQKPSKRSRHLAAEATKSQATKTSASDPPATSNRQTLDFMQRAAALRRNRAD